MNVYTYLDDVAVFRVTQQAEIEVNGEYEWRLEVEPKCTLPSGTKFVITVQPYQHQLSEEYLQCYDYWKPSYIYALADEESLEIDVAIKKVDTNFSHINRWKDSSRQAHITLIDEFQTGQSFHVQFGGVDRLFLKGDAAPTRVGIRAFNEDVCRIEKTFDITLGGHDVTRRLPVFPEITLKPGAAIELSLVAPTLVEQDKPFKLTMLAMDRFENPVKDYQCDPLTVVFTNLDSCERLQFQNVPYGDVEARLPTGRYLATAENTELHIAPAAIKVEETVEQKIYWGDTHTHSNLTANIRDNDCGAYPRNAYTYAKDVARLDFVALSEQTFTFNEDRSLNIDKATWQEIGEQCDKFNQEGAFVTFCGFELHGRRGDTVVLFKNSLLEEKYPDREVSIIHDIWDIYKGREFITIPHLHRFCNGRNPKHVDNQDAKFEKGFDLANWEPSSNDETMIEVYSAQWGRFEYAKNPMVHKARNNVKDNTVVDFLNRGKKFGFVSNSDGHDGNPGYGGITGVIADSQTRADIFDAMKARRTIATTHPRMFLDLQLDSVKIGNDASESDSYQLHIEAITPNPMTKVELVVNGEVFEKWSVGGHKFDITLNEFSLEEGATYVYLRVFQKDRNIGWTSPIWIK
ncbi:DUF3604 domain-containing protein [Vibrio wakamikoensis]|uniref:DUF3604 domain-containing protein n=1 Tax=Vibrio wakamikoensis TaxID=2910251 RepID=UPI003D2139C4